jgi:hypothetical protein
MLSITGVYNIYSVNASCFSLNYNSNKNSFMFFFRVRQKPFCRVWASAKWPTDPVGGVGIGKVADRFFRQKPFCRVWASAKWPTDPAEGPRRQCVPTPSPTSASIAAVGRSPRLSTGAGTAVRWRLYFEFRAI